jgi:hypothetical protein
LFVLSLFRREKKKNYFFGDGGEHFSVDFRVRH